MMSRSKIVKYIKRLLERKRDDYLLIPREMCEEIVRLLDS